MLLNRRGKNENGSKISFSRMDIEKEGKQLAQAKSVDVIYDREITFGTRQTINDVLKVEFELENGSFKSKEMILAFTETSELGKFIKAVKGNLPDRVYDFEKELLNKDLIVDITTNVKDGRTFYNITGFESASRLKTRVAETKDKPNPGSRIIRGSVAPLQEPESKNIDKDLKKSNPINDPKPFDPRIQRGTTIEGYKKEQQQGKPEQKEYEENKQEMEEHLSEGARGRRMEYETDNSEDYNAQYERIIGEDAYQPDERENHYNQEEF